MSKFTTFVGNCTNVVNLLKYHVDKHLEWRQKQLEKRTASACNSGRGKQYKTLGLSLGEVVPYSISERWAQSWSWGTLQIQDWSPESTPVASHNQSQTQLMRLVLGLQRSPAPETCERSRIGVEQAENWVSGAVFKCTRKRWREARSGVHAVGTEQWADYISLKGDATQILHCSTKSILPDVKNKLSTGILFCLRIPTVKSAKLNITSIYCKGLYSEWKSVHSFQFGAWNTGAGAEQAKDLGSRAVSGCEKNWLEQEVAEQE